MLTVSSLGYFPGPISQQQSIQSIWFQGHFGLVLWALSTRYAKFLKLRKNISTIFLFNEMPFFFGVRTKTEKIFKMSLTLILIFKL